MGRRFAVIAVTCTVGVTAASAAVPSKLVGTWTRTVTKADIDRAKAYGLSAGTVWTFVARKNGTGSVAGPAGRFDGSLIPAGANRLHINLGTSCPNVYTWRVSGRTLTFAKVNDCQPDRVGAFVGVWHKKG
jgi:hypothetical protein